MGRAPCCEKIGLKKGRWTSEEDELLTNYIAAHGEGSWRSLPKNAGLLRCGKSCRLRWINYLRSDLKRGNITPQEEETIIGLHASLGNRWSVIAGHLPGRTDNEIKNYWNSHLCKRIHEDVPLPLPVPVDPAKVSSKRKDGRHSKLARRKKKKQRDRDAEKSAQSEGGDSAVTDADPASGGGGGGEESGPVSSCGTQKDGEKVEEEAVKEEVTWLDWEMGEIECKLWENGGLGTEMWPWEWDSEKAYEQIGGTFVDNWQL